MLAALFALYNANLDSLHPHRSLQLPRADSEARPLPQLTSSSTASSPKPLSRFPTAFAFAMKATDIVA